jgi:hypothetical protein
MQEILLSRVIQANPGQTVEYNAATTHVYDVIEPGMETKALGIHVLGGMVGELLMTFSCLMEYTHASPSHDPFTFKYSEIEAFLTEMVEQDFSDDCCVLRLQKILKDQITSEKDLDREEEAVRILSDPAIHASYGLKFIIANSRDSLKIMPEVMDGMLRALVRIGLRELKPIVEVPSLTEEATDAEKDAYD